jgi:cell division protein FtsI/penicillin-binding protein 2
MEVPSMSGMMKASVLQQPQTPAEVFGLRALIKTATARPAAVNESEDEDEDEDEANASAILDGDKEFGSDD